MRPLNATALFLGALLAFATVAPEPAQARPRRFRTVRINCGGGKYVDAAGKRWRADRGFSGGERRIAEQGDVAGTDDDELFRSTREGDFAYRVRVPRGDYSVRLRFAETRYVPAGERRFDVRVEGATVLDDFDITAAVGIGRVFDLVKDVRVRDRFLTLRFDGDGSGATIAAIEIVKSSKAGDRPRLEVDGVTDFGVVASGGNGATSTVTLRNVGAAPLAVAGLRITGADAGSFALNDGSAGSIPAGATRDVTIRFHPAETRDHTAALQVLSDSDEGVLDAPLRGVGARSVDPLQGATLSPLDFGGVRLGRSSGRRVLRFDSAAFAGKSQTYRIEGRDAASFAVSGIAPRDLGTASLAGLGVSFTPRDDGAHDARLLLSAPAVGEVEVRLAGIGLAGAAGDATRINAGGGTYTDGQGYAWDADRDFSGGTPFADDDPIAGTADDTLYQSERYGDFEYVLPTGNGTFDVTLHFAEIYWTSPGDRVFDVKLEGATVIDDLDLVAVAGSSTAYVVTRTVAVLDGSLTATFSTGVDNAKLSALEVVQVGGASGDGDLSVSPASLNFPGTEPGTGSSPQTVTLTNQGTEALTVTDVLVEGANALDFTHDASAPYTLAAGASATFDVTFGPQDAGDRSAQLRLADDSPAADVIVPLHGVGDSASGHGFMHAVAGPPQVVTDADLDGAETVTLDGAASHTHELGVSLASWVWREGGQTIATGATPAVSLPAGVHDIELTITDALGKTDTDTTRVEVVDPSRVPGLLAYYYEGLDDPTSLPDFSKLDPTFVEVVDDVDIPSNSSSIGGVPTTENVGARFVGYLDVPQSGRYRLRIESDAGSALYIDGKRVIDHDGLHGMSRKTTRRWLAKGLRRLELRYFNALNPAGLILKWRPPGGSWQVIPASALVHAQVGVEPALLAADPPVLAPSGGTPVTLTGVGFFDEPVSVRFGGVSVPSSSFTSRSFTRIVVPCPAGAGTSSVSVSTANGTTTSLPVTYDEQAAVPVSFDIAGIATVAQPTSLAFGPDGRLYVASVSGTITALTLDAGGQVVSSTTYDAVKVADPSRQILGLAFNPADVSPQPAIYVAHTQLFSPSLYPGKVSILRGPDYDTLEDVITGLPVSDHDHGNNGMEFGALGELYVAMGGNTNAGVPDAAFGMRDESVLSAAILRANIHLGGYDGAVTYDQPTNALTANQTGGFGVEVFAPGFRNPYDLVLHSNGNLYATDNGPNHGFGGSSTGCGLSGPDPETADELILVRQGDYYGHPNRNRGRSDSRQCIFRPADAAPGAGYTQAMALVPSSSNGMAEYTANTFGGALRGQLLVVQFNQDLRRYQLSADGESVVDEEILGPGGLDVVQGPDGSIYVADYGNNAVVRYGPVEPAPSTFTIRDTFPNRGSVVGGTVLRVTGTGFGGIGGTTVTVGGQAMTLNSVTPTEIVGVLPPGAAAGAVDVVVTTDGVTKTFAQGFRYVGGSTGVPGGTWERGPDMSTAVGECTVAAAAGKIYVMAGGSPLVQTYDIGAGVWVDTTAPLPTTFDGSDHTVAATVDGLVYVIGGISPPSSDVHVYDPATNDWTLRTSIRYQGQTYAFGGQAVGVIGSKIYLGGGLEDDDTPVGTCVVYDTITDTWSDLPPMPVALNHAAGVGYGGRFWIFGGRPGTDFPHAGSDLVQVYDPVTDTWDSTTYTMPTARAATGPAVELDGRLLVMGGEGDGPLNGMFPHVEELEPITNTWRRLADMPTPRHGTMPVVWNHHVYVAGGGTSEGFSESTILEVLHAEGTGDALPPLVSIAEPQGPNLEHAPTLTLSMSDNEALDDATWRFDDGPVHPLLTDIGQPSLIDYPFTPDDTEFHDLPDGPHVLRIEVTDASGNLGVKTWTFSTGEPPSVEVLVNCGGGAHVDALGRTWLSDQGAIGGATYSVDAAIGGTTEDALYQSERWGEFAYQFVVPNDTYTVKLHFAEIYFGTFETGARVASWDIEGARVLSDLDIFSEVGSNAALVKTFTATVTDGALTIQSVSGVENPKLSAIEIIPAE